MSQTTLPDLTTYYGGLTYPERLVFDRLVGDREREKAYPEVHPVMRRLNITAGFTISNVQGLMDDFKAARAGVEAQRLERLRAECQGLPLPVPNEETSLIGWIFKFPKTGPLAVTDIEVLQMNMVLGGTNTTFPQPELRHGDGSAVTLRPKVFFQLKDVDTDAMDLPYPIAFLYTRPGIIDAPDLKTSDLEGYFPWADLAMLQRANIADLADFVFHGPTATYNDLFFSGARLDYGSMHHPSMRLEQLNLKDSATGTAVGPDSQTPFTLKAEPYVADETAARNWVPVKGGQAPLGNLSGSDMINAVNTPTAAGRSGGSAGDESPPISAHLFPCPTIWEYSNELALMAMRTVGSEDPEDMRALRSAFYQRFTGKDVSKEPIEVKTVSLASRPVTFPPADDAGGDDSTPPKQGCFGLALALLLLIICLLV